MTHPAQTPLEHALRLVLELEGGEVNHPADRGGHTSRGITLATLQVATRKGLVPAGTTISNLTAEQARRIYVAMYWDPSRCSELPGCMALAVFDQAVTSGAGRAARTLQMAVRERADGVIGFRTLAAAQAADPERTVRRLITFREAQMLDIVERNPDQRVFLRGWLNRLDRVEAECLGRIA
jgi:lysozyme family protein